jgi:hypothetical protein
LYASATMGASTGDPALVTLVIAGLDNGVLWILESGPIWFGRGTNKPSLVCKRRISAEELQYDLPGPRGSGPAHVACYRTWRAECDNRRKNKAN